jgi:acyl carrier protein
MENQNSEMDVNQRMRAIINETLAETGREPLPTITRDTLLRKDVGLDSLELAVLTVKLEAEFGVDVFADGLVTTVGEVEDRLLGR